MMIHSETVVEPLVLAVASIVAPVVAVLVVVSWTRPPHSTIIFCGVTAVVLQPMVVKKFLMNRHEENDVAAVVVAP